jgi:hypothetical protein
VRLSLSMIDLMREITKTVLHWGWGRGIAGSFCQIYSEKSAANSTVERFETLSICQKKSCKKLGLWRCGCWREQCHLKDVKGEYGACL